MKIIGLVIADDCEFAPVKDYALSNGGVSYIFNSDETVEFSVGDKTVIANLCGIGKVNATNSAAALIFGKNVDAIINFGLSGAVSGLRKGDLVVGTKCVEHDFDLTALGYKPGVKPQTVNEYAPDKTLYDAVVKATDNMRDGTFVCGDMFVASEEKKRFVIDNFGANACDMESAAIASVCHKAEIPFVSFRSISDDADDVAPDTYNAQNEKKQTDLIEVAVKAIELL